MISKKLLSEVLNMEIIGTREADVFIMFQVYTPLGVDERGINVYELAHKCKEWAVNGGLYKLESATFKNSDTGKIEGTANVGKYHFPQDTETQAVFKACEWILDNNNGEDNVSK